MPNSSKGTRKEWINAAADMGSYSASISFILNNNQNHLQCSNGSFIRVFEPIFKALSLSFSFFKNLSALGLVLYFYQSLGIRLVVFVWFFMHRLKGIKLYPYLSLFKSFPSPLSSSALHSSSNRAFLNSASSTLLSLRTRMMGFLF